MNDVYVGDITPTAGNWQSARINGNKTIALAKGANVIAVATKAPEFPAVETLKIALTDNDATFRSEGYDSYIDDALAGRVYGLPSDEDAIAMSSNALTTVGIQHFSNLPLLYTHYNIITFTQGEEIFITSSSLTDHKLDVVYYGRELPPFIFNPTSSANGLNDMQTSTHLDNSSVFEPLAPPYTIPPPYIRATSEEMQGLNWVGPSQKALNSNKQVATVHIKIPKTGMYLIRLRAKANGATAIADLNVNGTYYYDDVPISFTYVDCKIPDDGNKYATMTCCNTFGEDDPYLFIHGANADRIVGFNDDGPRNKLEYYNLSSRDSYIAQTYLMKTSGISVSNYSSYEPVSKCNIIARFTEDAAPNTTQMRTKSIETADIANPIADNDIICPLTIELGSNISIKAADKIKKVSAYTLSGHCIGIAYGNDTSLSIPISNFNIFNSGIYVICVETENGITSKTISVKIM